jgi:hypothetical protein
MDKITWNHVCYYCHRPIQRGRPTLLFSIEEPKLIGVSHSRCCATSIEHGHFQTCPPFNLSIEQVSFLTHFFPRLYALPGGMEPNRELRYCAANVLHPYPESMLNPIGCVEKVRDEYRNKPQDYAGDLEADFLRFLGQVKKAAKGKPVDVEVDFRTFAA